MTAPVRCKRCQTPLRAPASIARRYSLRCSRLERQEAAALAQAAGPYSPDQRKRALNLIACNGVTPTNRDGVYRVLSSDGRKSYLVIAAGNCSCIAGQHEQPCYHALAATLYDLGQRLALLADYGKAA